MPRRLQGSPNTVPKPRVEVLRYPRIQHKIRLQYLEPQCIITLVKLTKDLVAASAVPLILSLLEDGESYGYAIIQRIGEISKGEIAWTDGMLYPVLHRLEGQGWIQANWRTSDAGRKRKYYSLASKGRQALADQKQQWLLVQRTLTTLWRAQHA
jgi:PadR family transcriptional regulator, regulatory protein PadR